MARPRAALRGQILNSALRLFAAHGFRATSLQDIASDAGCSKASLLYHFANKDAILTELLAPLRRRGSELRAELAPLTGEPLVRAAVTGFVDMALAFRYELTVLFHDLPGTTGHLAADPDHDLPLIASLAGRSDDPRDRAAAWLVLGGVAISAYAAPTTDAVLREELIRAALRALGHDPDRPPSS
ncbi:TetR/AcrR family transcriptional regulator [Streptomyces hainanensis]|uniref:TetR/AcrR family transcriptional regulator n=1 Tax=Streptomyces hainanensis TaxID=402648 RepID=A0A4R4TF12_9ACTN|nr:TetR family transcriptional regulator [Streptomyces hainanensis]TDC74194.1 TetR/AcrR family transcriptional regulator [Streptomyces hainanensis]